MSFSQLCRPKSRILSPERKKEIATQLNNEGFNCKNGDRVSIPGVGLNLTKRECYELAVSMDPTLAEAFYNLGTLLKSGEQAQLGALMLSERECFRRACELDSCLAPAWFNLGVSLRLPNNSQQQQQQQQQNEEEAKFFSLRRDDFTGELIPHVLVGDVQFSKRECYTRALEIDKTLAYAWFNLGIALGANDIALIGDLNQDKEKQGKHRIWNAVKGFLEVEEEDLEHSSFSDMDCFISCLNLDSSIPAAWAMAGRRLSNVESSDEAFCGKNIKLSNVSGNEDEGANSSSSSSQDLDESQTKQQQQKPTIQVKDKFFNAHECFVESLKLDPQASAVWFLAGSTLETDQAVFAVGENIYDKQGAFEQSLEKFEFRSVVWYELGATLIRKKRARERKNNNNNNNSTSSSVVSYAFVKGKKCTPLNCFVKCLELDDYNAKAWFNLGVLLDQNVVSIEVEGQVCTEQICFEKCLSLDPTIGLAWFNLASTLKASSSKDENKKNKIQNTCRVGEEEYSQGECFVLCLSQHPRHRASWFHLGRWLEEEQQQQQGEEEQDQDQERKIQLVDGEFVNAKNCYEKCLELDLKDLSAWKRLTKILMTNRKIKDKNVEDSVTIRGKSFSQDDCMKMILSLS
jgi:tetratricopeptide (TPR) repeat protein